MRGPLCTPKHTPSMHNRPHNTRHPSLRGPLCTPKHTPSLHNGPHNTRHPPLRGPLCTPKHTPSMHNGPHNTRHPPLRGPLCTPKHTPSLHNGPHNTRTTPACRLRWERQLPDVGSRASGQGELPFLPRSRVGPKGGGDGTRTVHLNKGCIDEDPQLFARCQGT